VRRLGLGVLEGADDRLGRFRATLRFRLSRTAQREVSRLGKLDWTGHRDGEH
jgi:hypothetical protein